MSSDKEYEETSYKYMWLKLKSHLAQDIDRAKEAVPLWINDDKNDGLWACRELIDRARFYKEVLDEAERLEDYER